MSISYNILRLNCDVIFKLRKNALKLVCCCVSGISHISVGVNCKMKKKQKKLTLFIIIEVLKKVFYSRLVMFIMCFWYNFEFLNLSISKHNLDMNFRKIK